jgi:HK97 family phage portal protein
VDNDLKWQSIGVSPQDSQMIESQKFSVVEVARCFRVPLNLVMDYERSTYSNVTEQNRSFLTHTLQPWLTRIEQAISKSLLTEAEKEKYFVEHLTQGFLRADTKTRFESYKIAIEAGFLTIDEVRQLENMNALKTPEARVLAF